MATRKTCLAIDEELLDAARAELGTKTVRETVERALLHVLRARARRDEIEALACHEGMDLGDEELMSGAWRP